MAPTCKNRYETAMKPWDTGALIRFWKTKPNRGAGLWSGMKPDMKPGMKPAPFLYALYIYIYIYQAINLHLLDIE